MDSINIATSRSYSFVNRISLPKVWKDKDLPAGVLREMKAIWTGKLGWQDQPNLRQTRDLLNMLSNKVMPRETLIEIHNDISNLFKREVSKVAKVNLPNKHIVMPITLPAFSGRVTEAQVKQLVAKIGVELEGGWEKAPYLRTKPDGSVSVAANHLGEIAMPPYPPTEFPWETERTGFYANYPTAVNDTCGMHVHFSFPHPSLYASLVSKEFSEWLLQGLEVWGKSHSIRSKRFYSRLHGNNRYCQRSYWSQYQLGIRGTHTGERYSAVNYCLMQHGTMEVRVLPMFKSKEISRKAITELVRLVCLWLAHQAPGKNKAVMVATTEYDARELPKEFHFRGPTETEINGEAVGEHVGDGTEEFDHVSFVLSQQ